MTSDFFFGIFDLPIYIVHTSDTLLCKPIYLVKSDAA